MWSRWMVCVASPVFHRRPFSAARTLPPPSTRAAAVMASSMSNAKQSLSVAVIGAGPAGIISARELLLAGHRVTVFERSSKVGGIWDYRETFDEDDLLGQRASVRGSVYAYLRTNLPREVMGLPDFAFDSKFEGSRDARQFPAHDEVQRYLEAFADEFELLQFVRFGMEVQRCVPVQGHRAEGTVPSTWLRWEVVTRPAAQLQDNEAAASSELYDAVVVANGHYSRPRVPQLPGQAAFPGLLMHSHSYRRPDPFKGKTVVVLGASSSGVDLAEEIANGGAKNIHAGSGGGGSHDSDQIIKAPNLQEFHADGSITLADGSRIADVDACVFCTGHCSAGYIYDFPFLAGTDFVTVEDNRVGPLYQHIFPPAAAPTLAFVGIPWKVIPFPQFQLQSRWIAKVLAGAVQLPSRQEMEQHVADFYASLKATGVPVRYTHRQSDGMQWQYNAWLAEQCGDEPGAAWREQMYKACGQSRKTNASKYRDASLPGAEEAEQAAREEACRARQRAVHHSRDQSQ
ncbi:hypothetical protein CHLNCDRAFT_30388 [Chlorella variabilis]|uniref:Flavin-containing monooxygenase n=1 Tax=Chlorella variabilis TaxID=554065 RepID=E1Z947_CHLVA|nr:hypothetical protein CHLNCDRAFT_30388 [Chlorella variabilis]EFN57454.1 hypothetical protein CHLNCDRAFT_30388 [Chlorella variabilis]|eukprot:XP_005849556.1 hypothetical protein CHLNCDRAFT_30388 [Chlorella variabilis]